ncbi:hypothetical protein J6590_020562 [Homalodisca vitripennis]|nr:hypothetical protein J6590_020562 [Homalodisca vitripennis]
MVPEPQVRCHMVPAICLSPQFVTLLTLNMLSPPPPPLTSLGEMPYRPSYPSLHFTILLTLNMLSLSPPPLTSLALSLAHFTASGMFTTLSVPPISMFHYYEKPLIAVSPKRTYALLPELQDIQDVQNLSCLLGIGEASSVASSSSQSGHGKQYSLFLGFKLFNIMGTLPTHSKHPPQQGTLDVPPAHTIVNISLSHYTLMSCIYELDNVNLLQLKYLLSTSHLVWLSVSYISRLGSSYLCFINQPVIVFGDPNLEEEVAKECHVVYVVLCPEQIKYRFCL